MIEDAARLAGLHTSASGRFQFAIRLVSRGAMTRFPATVSSISPPLPVKASYSRDPSPRIITQRISVMDHPNRYIMSKIAIIADFTTKPGSFDAFCERMKAHAAASREEPGCLRFDIVVPQNSENHLMLYEMYSDQAAFDFHAGTERIKAHREATATMTTGRTVTVCDLMESGED